MVRWLRFAATAIAGALAWVLLLPAAPLSQPLAFNHARHQTVACAVCHRGAETSARAGIPQGDMCIKCHATAPAAAGAAALWPELARGRPIGWLRVTRVPDHVMFSHRRHVTLGGLACESCHADIGQRTAPPPRAPMRLKMDTCLACHQREGASADCAACHR